MCGDWVSMRGVENAVDEDEEGEDAMKDEARACRCCCRWSSCGMWDGNSSE